MRKRLSHWGAVWITREDLVHQSKGAKLKQILVQMRAVRYKPLSEGQECRQGLQFRGFYDMGNAHYKGWFTDLIAPLAPALTFQLNVEHTGDLVEGMLALSFVAETAVDSAQVEAHVGQLEDIFYYHTKVEESLFKWKPKPVSSMVDWDAAVVLKAPQAKAPRPSEVGSAASGAHKTKKGEGKQHKTAATSSKIGRSGGSQSSAPPPPKTLTKEGEERRGAHQGARHKPNQAATKPKDEGIPRN